MTHDINEAQYLADRICVINDGRVTQTGTPDEIRENPADDFVRDLFHHTRRRKH